MKEKLFFLIKTKGYYLILAGCILAVGGVSFLSYRAAQKKQSETPLAPREDTQVEKVEEAVPDPRVEEETPDESPAPQVEPVKYTAPLAGELIAPYSPEQPIYSYTLKDWRTHAGIDLAAPPETQVLNVSEGVVEAVTTEDLMGLTVTVRHTDGKRSRYASLATAAVEEGQLLAMGDPIGTVGKSMLLECGETEHLHYELWSNDQPVDPTFLIASDSDHA